jgi:hypothetical protein
LNPAHFDDDQSKWRGREGIARLDLLLRSVSAPQSERIDMRQKQLGRLAVGSCRERQVRLLGQQVVWLR